MKKNPFIIVGVWALIITTVVLAAWQWNIHTATQKAQEYVAKMRSFMPESQSAVLEQRSDNTMPVLSMAGTDFVGILEVPSANCTLPVSADWGQSSQFPCRFAGSLYDGSLQLGSTTQAGQFDFYRQLSVGDSLFFTDMTGNRYGYAITDICYRQHADSETLGSKDADLTIFIKNIYGFDYIILFCDAQK